MERQFFKFYFASPCIASLLLSKPNTTVWTTLASFRSVLCQFADNIQNIIDLCISFRNTPTVFQWNISPWFTSFKEPNKPCFISLAQSTAQAQCADIISVPLKLIAESNADNCFWLSCWSFWFKETIWRPPALFPCVVLFNWQASITDCSLLSDDILNLEHSLTLLCC